MNTIAKRMAQARISFACLILVWILSDNVGATELSCPPPSPAVAAEALGIDIAQEQNNRRGESLPNVIIILADDLSYAGMSVNGGDIPTPNLDRLAREGARFTNGYSASGICSPARAALLTGKQPMAIPHLYNIYLQHKHGLSLKEKTLADYFSELGYVTGMIGKWHLGVGNTYQPGARGFDEYLLAVHPEKDEPDTVFGKFNVNSLHGFSQPNGCGQENYFRSDTIAMGAAHFILRHRGVPFFLYLPTFATHFPHTSREESLFKRLSYYLIPAYVKRNVKARKYFKSLVYLDEAVGHVLDTIDFLNLSGNTLIWFLSDNGDRKGFHQLGPLLRTGKGTFYEDAIRVPFIARWTGTILPGVYEWPVQSLDILPTSLAAVGAASPLSENESPYVTGRNILPYLKHPSDPPDRYLYWKMRWYNFKKPHLTYPTNSAIRFGNWKLLTTKLAGKALDNKLYNLQDDPGETNNLLSAYRMGKDFQADLDQTLSVFDIFLELSGKLDAATEFIPD